MDDSTASQVMPSRPVAVGPPNARRKCCTRCACRNTSPLAHDDLTQQILQYAQQGDPFICHVGVDDRCEPDCADWTMRGDGVAVRADGQPGELCAGWWAYRRASLRGAGAAA